MKVSIVIPTRDNAETIGVQLEALARQDWRGDFEVVVGDNGSTDETLRIVESFKDVFPHLVVVDVSERRGSAHARNAAVRRASGEYVVFCDSDDKVAPDWLGEMVNALDSNAFVAARLEHYELNPEWLVAVRGEAQTESLANTDPPFLPFGYCAALGVHRELHDRVGGFDATFEGGGEDNDYCYRIQIAGTPLTFVPGAVVHYRHRTSMKSIFRQARGYGRGNARLFWEYRSYGMRRPPQLRALGGWLLLVPRLVYEAPSKQGRVRWMVRLGEKLGRLEESVRVRTFVL